MNDLLRRGACYAWAVFLGGQAVNYFRQGNPADGFTCLGIGLLWLYPALSR